VLIRFWGTRGSIPTPDRRTNYFGGNTSCVEVRTGDDHAIVLDCGTGVRPLGLDILGRGESLPPLHILITHTHWDHIQGFPFFLPAYVPGARLTFYGTRGLEQSLEASISGQMHQTYFPVQLGELRAEVDFVELGEQRFTLGSCRVTTQYLNHTAPTIGYRFEHGRLKFAYITDHEPFWWPPTGLAQAGSYLHPGDQRHIAFVAGVDLLIHDAQYSDREYPAKRGWGHSPIEYVVDVAIRAGVRRLVLFHHDPLHSDAWVRQHTEAARRRARAAGSSLEILAASEGLEIRLAQPVRPIKSTVNGTSRVAASGRGGRILVAGSTADAAREIRDALAGDGYEITLARNGKVARLAARQRPHLLILLGARRERALLDTVKRVRGEAWGASLPILVVAGSEGPGVAGRLADRLTDVLTRPLNPAFLRPRVRAWLSRGATSGPAGRGLHRQRIVSAAIGPERGFLRGLPLGERAALFIRAQTARFRQGEIIFKEGDPAGGLYLIRTGRVRLSVREGGREIVLGTAKTGDTLGELAALDGGPRTATARAVRATAADYIPRELFRASLSSAPAAAVRLLQLMAGRLRETDPHVGELASLERQTGAPAPEDSQPAKPAEARSTRRHPGRPVFGQRRGVLKMRSRRRRS
jgi:phosphoribosyl 1,2-cyclic phosphodiesterase/CRP-like cAMP-binding protein/CheY-like chemotaxis protein